MCEILILDMLGIYLLVFYIFTPKIGYIIVFALKFILVSLCVW